MTRMRQDYGQWVQLPQPGGLTGILAPVTYECNWIFQTLEDDPNGPARYWKLRWQPAKPRICIYFQPASDSWPDRTPFACRSPYDPLYNPDPDNQGTQFFPTTNIHIIDSFNTTNGEGPTPISTTSTGGVTAVPPGNNPFNTATPGPNPPSSSVPPNPNLQINGLVFNLFLTHDQVATIQETSNVAATVVADPFIIALILAASGFITQMDDLGNDNGVDISGVIGTPEIIVTPHGLFNIFRVISDVQGIVTLVADETSNAAKAGINAVVTAVKGAGGAAKDGENAVAHFFSSI